jgi:hypothetical protein
MTPGQLIDLLEKAGMLKEESPGVLGWHPTMKKAEHFAALVAAAEREACAKVCEQWEWANNAAAAIRARGQE